MRSKMKRQFCPKGDDSGATMLEYILVATGIAVVVGIAAAALGLRLIPLFDAVTF